MLGDLVRAHRLRLALTQEELAAKTGMSARHIRDLEAGRVTRPRPNTVRLLIGVLGLDDIERERLQQAALPQVVAAETGVPGAGRVLEQPPTSTQPRWVAPARYLPRTIGDFTGRAETVRRLLDATAPGISDSRGPTVLVIDGMAGSGKTTLAVHVAYLLAQDYPDGQLFVDLQGHSARGPLKPSTVVPSLLRQLGIETERIPDSLGEQIELWRQELSGRRALVLLDDAASSAQLVGLLPASPGSVCLVTSRRRLTGLDGVHLESLPALDESEAVALLRRIVGLRVDAEPVAALQVVSQCGRLPLAIRLAGSRLAHRPHWRVADLLGRLGASALPELAAEDRTVAGAFALSYGQLTEPVRRVFRLLGLHPGQRFGTPAVAALTQLPLGDAQDGLDDLVDVHLLEEPEPHRYRLHDLVRQYARALADSLPSNERRAALAGLLDLHLHTTAALTRAHENATAVKDFPAGPALRPDLVERAAAVPSWLEEQRTDLVSLIRAAVVVGEHERGWQLARVTWRFLYAVGSAADLIAVQAQGLAAAQEAGDPDAVALMNNVLASGHYRAGRYPEALSCLTNMLNSQISQGDRIGEARALANIGGVQHRAGQPAEALATSERGYTILLELNDVAALVRYRANLSLVKLTLGLHEEALRDARLALQGSLELGQSVTVSCALLHLASARLRLRHVAAAERLLLATLQRARRLRMHADEGEIVGLLGSVAMAQGLPELAAQRHRESLRLLREHGQLPGVAQASNELGAALLAVHDVAGAIEMHNSALTMARRLNYPLEEGRALHGLAACQAHTDPENARRHWQLALDIFTRIGVPDRLDTEKRLAELQRSIAAAS